MWTVVMSRLGSAVERRLAAVLGTLMQLLWGKTWLFRSAVSLSHADGRSLGRFRDACRRLSASVASCYRYSDESRDVHESIMLR
jgi:hypothetical protein